MEQTEVDITRTRLAARALFPRLLNQERLIAFVGFNNQKKGRDRHRDARPTNPPSPLQQSTDDASIHPSQRKPPRSTHLAIMEVIHSVNKTGCRVEGTDDDEEGGYCLPRHACALSGEGRERCVLLFGLFRESLRNMHNQALALFSCFTLTHLIL